MASKNINESELLVNAEDQEIKPKKNLCYSLFDKLIKLSIIKVSIGLFHEGRRSYKNKRLLCLSILFVALSCSFAYLALTTLGKIKQVMQYDV